MRKDLDIDQLRQDLEEQHAQLLTYLKIKPVSSGSHTKTKTANPDRADLAQDYFSRDRRTALQERMEDTLQQVENALDRIDKGIYGKCENCGKNISPERLEALPYAQMCIECQELEEKGIN